jgi:hypothetical protein
VGLKEVEQHVPGADGSSLINAGEETSKILVDEVKVSIDGSCLQDGEWSVNIARSEMVWARHWNELENQSG